LRIAWSLASGMAFVLLVLLISHTLALTTLGRRRTGQRATLRLIFWQVRRKNCQIRAWQSEYPGIIPSTGGFLHVRGSKKTLLESDSLAPHIHSRRPCIYGWPIRICAAFDAKGAAARGRRRIPKPFGAISMETPGDCRRRIYNRIQAF